MLYICAMKKTGIYVITNTINNKIYIGSSSYNVDNRLLVHKRFLRQGKHENSYLQSSYNKYGVENFKFEVFELCEKERCIEREQYWMDFYKSYKRGIGFNINEIANSRLNSKHSEESKQRMRKAKLGKKLTKEHILNSKLARTGQKRSQKTIDLQNLKKYKKLLQYSIEGVFIKEWNSLEEAQLFFKVKGAIGNCVRKGFNYTSCGYRWKYKVNNLIIRNMDEFLKPNAAYDRLYREYKKYGSLIVAVDFDSTLYDFHGIGESYEQVRQLVRDLFKANCFIAIWTGNQNTEFVINFLKENYIPYDSINDEAPVSKKLLGDNIPRKLYANVYIDDRAGLEQVYKDLKKLLHEVTKKTFYRVAHSKTGQGLWYNNFGNFTGLIHEEFKFCKNTELKMDFDPELVGWLSAADSLEALFQWFTEEDIKELQKHGWCIAKYETSEYKFYEKFQHYVIKQDSITFLEDIKL